MLKLSLIHFTIVAVGYPFLNAYMFFLVYGVLLKQRPMGLAIEGIGLSPNGALLAAVIGMLFCFILSIPCALIQILAVLKTQSSVWTRNILWITSIVLGLSLGIGLSVNHFKSYFLVLPLQGFFSGILLATLLSFIWEVRVH